MTLRPIGPTQLWYDEGECKYISVGLGGNSRISPDRSLLINHHTQRAVQNRYGFLTPNYIYDQKMRNKLYGFTRVITCDTGL